MRRSNPREGDDMTTLREAAQQALDALREIEWSNNSRWQGDRAREAKNNLSAMLEQSDHTEQPIEMVATCKECLPVEPVAWMVYTLDGRSVFVTDNPKDFTENHRALPLYTAPPQRKWQGLTHEERDEICKDFVGDDDRVGAYRSFALEVEVRLTEKNK